jgi:hypothetical protein
MISNIFLVLIPLIAYWATDIVWVLLLWILTLPVVIFGKLKEHHENQMFVEPRKVRFYQRAYWASYLTLAISAALIEFIAIAVEALYT